MSYWRRTPTGTWHTTPCPNEPADQLPPQRIIDAAACPDCDAHIHAHLSARTPGANTWNSIILHDATCPAANGTTPLPTDILMDGDTTLRWPQ